MIWSLSSNSVYNGLDMARGYLVLIRYLKASCHVKLSEKNKTKKM